MGVGGGDGGEGGGEIVQWRTAFWDRGCMKDAALVGVLRALAEMDSKQPQAAWLDQTLPPEW